MQETDALTLFKLHLPPQAVSYCFDLWERNNFHLKIERARRSKFGDYRFNPATGTHSISINNDLNPYSFLVTYLHEVAHLFTFREYGRKTRPHGKQWKKHFQLLMEPLLSLSIFPADVQTALHSYMKNPAATSCSDPHLLSTLHQYDTNKVIYLKDIAFGKRFMLHDRQFKKGALKRTRFVCEETKSGRQYLISGLASIKMQD